MNKEDKEELLKEIDRRLKVLKDEFIASLDDKKEFKLTYPKDRKDFYYIDSADGRISTTVYYTNDIDCNFLFEHGYFFESKEEAEQHLKERKLLFKLHQWAKLKNDGWAPDWKDYSEGKYYIYYSNKEKNFNTGNMLWTNEFSKVPYFKSREIAQECIDLFGDEIKEVLC
jgi:hypothetical protein